MGLEVSKARARRYGKARRREERHWRSLNGPVTVTRIAPDEDAETRAARNAFLADWAHDDEVWNATPET